MRDRISLLLLLIFCAFPAMALKSGCPAEYSAEQCEQLKDGDGDDGSVDGGGPSTCPYYMCGNATAGVQSSWDWCEATQKWEDCPIAYCEYKWCVGSNCYPTSMTCSACSSRQGNNVHTSECPRS